MSPDRTTVATVARALTAAAVMLSAVVHLELWAQGMRDVDLIGPAFLLNAVGGLAIALAVLLWASPLPLLAAIAFGLSTLGAYVMSVTVGLFGMRGQLLLGVPEVLAAVSEIAAVVLAVVALVVERRRRASGAEADPSAGAVRSTAAATSPTGPDAAAVRPRRPARP
ncbi:MAG: hypothetical protein JWP95_2252 [Actinotalea sp.]|nr:hypothetical protein [Actinotalea sp.]